MIMPGALQRARIGNTRHAIQMTYLSMAAYQHARINRYQAPHDARALHAEQSTWPRQATTQR